jgi:hypothetical protein
VGRLKQPLQVRKGNPQIMEWIEKNPEGYILISDRKASQIPTFPIAALESSEFVQPYRSGQLHLIAASQALSPEDGGKE